LKKGIPNNSIWILGVVFEIKIKMKTNYQNLSLFEGLSVIVAVIGVALIGFEVYASCSSSVQSEIASAFSIFDIHEQTSATISNIQFVMATTQAFYDEFDLAFQQTFSYPDQIGEPILHFASAVGTYADSIAGNYSQSSIAMNNRAGEVLGVSFSSDVTADISVEQYIPVKKSTENHYHYLAPSFVKTFDQ
jgi:hypothetical protein